jgi:integrase
VSVVTYEGYEALLRRHALPRLGNLKLDELSPLQIQDLYRELLAGSEASGPLSAGTVLNLHLVLTQAFGQAVRWQLLAANPVAGAQPPRPRRAPRLLVDPALLARLLASVAGSWLEAPAAIAAATGMRRGEALGLRWADLADDLSAAQVQRTLQPTREGLVFESPKTARSRRTVLLPDFLRPYLERQRADQDDRRTTTPAWQELDLVVDRGDGRPLNPDTLSTRLRHQHPPALRPLRREPPLPGRADPRPGARARRRALARPLHGPRMGRLRRRDVRRARGRSGAAPGNPAAANARAHGRTRASSTG